jgi:lipoyl(octanoyl) transferase
VRELTVTDLGGGAGYAEVLALQERLHARRAAGEVGDTLLLLEHRPVYTLGRSASEGNVLYSEDALRRAGIERAVTSRGGDVTYHGPGQLVGYPMIDLARAGLGVRALVEGIEQAIVATVAQWGVVAAGRRDAPGVYVEGRKLASIGLRIRRSRSYHGLALNVAMDLGPFRRINPCGYAGLEMTQLAELGGPADLGVVADALAPRLLRSLGYGANAQSATSTWRQDVSSV